MPHRTVMKKSFATRRAAAIFSISFHLGACQAFAMFDDVPASLGRRPIVRPAWQTLRRLRPHVMNDQRALCAQQIRRHRRPYVAEADKSDPVAHLPILSRRITRCCPIKLNSFAIRLQILRREFCARRLVDRSLFSSLSSPDSIGRPSILRAGEGHDCRIIIANSSGYWVTRSSRVMTVREWRHPQYAITPLNRTVLTRRSES